MPDTPPIPTPAPEPSDAPRLQGSELLDSDQAGPSAIRGSVVRTVGYVGGVLLSIVSASLIIRHLGVIDFGRYVTVISLIALVQTVTDAGLTGVGVREFTMRHGHEQERLMRNLIGLRLALATVGVGGALLFAVLAGYDRTLVLGTAAAGWE